MRRASMRLALLLGVVALSFTEPVKLTIPTLQVPGLPGRAVTAAEAAVSREASRIPFSRPDNKIGPSGSVAAQAVASAGAAVAIQHAGYAIPADRPHAPIGRFKLTAYSGPQLGQAYPITATGTSARAGRTVAVDPRVIPLGSRIYIEGLGERIAEDVGGGIKGRHIDVYLPSRSQARVFGVQRATVSLLAAPESAG